MKCSVSYDPIFILGILPRSGTNYLSKLLSGHPDCGVPVPIREDCVLEHSHHLTAFVQEVYKHWIRDPKWGVNKEVRQEFYQHLGQGVISFLETRIGNKRLITKTPSVQNLSDFFTLFPNAYLLILVRDGRDVVESSARSFGWDPDETAEQWAKAAETILEFDRVNHNQDRKYMIVRYEDLVRDLENELTKIMQFLDLDVEVYKFENAENLPVYGSSTFRGKTNRVNWQGIQKTQDFNPLQRWSSWSRKQHERFNWIAGELLPKLGYQPKRYPKYQRVWRIYNILLDLAKSISDKR